MNNESKIRSIRNLVCMGALAISGVLAGGCMDPPALTLRQSTVRANVIEVTRADHEIFMLIKQNRQAARDKYRGTKVRVTGAINYVGGAHLGEISMDIDGERVVIYLDSHTEQELKGMLHQWKTFEGTIWNVDRFGFFINDTKEL